MTVGDMYWIERRRDVDYVVEVDSCGKPVKLHVVRELDMVWRDFERGKVWRKYCGLPGIPEGILQETARKRLCAVINFLVRCNGVAKVNVSLYDVPAKRVEKAVFYLPADWSEEDIMWCIYVDVDWEMVQQFKKIRGGERGAIAPRGGESA